jgi:hypothetical protein
VELLNPLDDAQFAAQTTTYTGTAGTVTGWPAGPQGVAVWCTTDAYVKVGEGVTATTASTPIPANTMIPFKVPVGTGAPWRVSAIQVSSGGSVFAKPFNIT